MINDFEQTIKAAKGVAELAADRARAISNRWFRSALQVTRKTDSTPVTIADTEVEQCIRETVFSAFAEHGFIGEESASERSDSIWQWVADPIDGTKSFSTGHPGFGTLIALLHHQRPVLGLIDMPKLDERWMAVQGENTRHNNTPCRSRDTRRIEDATVYSTTVDMFDESGWSVVDAFTRCARFRVFGGDCYAYGLIASGFNDIVIEADLKPYDYFALVPVIEGAGGKISDWQGQPLTFDTASKQKGQVLATANAALHEAALELLDSLR